MKTLILDVDVQTLAPLQLQVLSSVRPAQLIAVEKEHFVPIQTHYWDNKRVLIKRLDVDPTSISSYQATEKGEPKEVWVALSSKMTQLKLDTFTELNIEDFKANPNLRSRHFSERELTASR